ncbi:hypothetical protein FACS18945_4780 [Bacteroidia bacterium]|nr:hypothetical protein FACS18945_4780 [Bacteroidia bacterium]
MSYAGDCMQFKKNPKLEFKILEQEVKIIPSNHYAEKAHGHVNSSMETAYEIQTITTNFEDGYCVLLNKVSFKIGYNDFIIHINPEYEKDSCEYEIVLKHEMQHVDAYLSVINMEKKRLEESFHFSANSIFPIFIKDLSELEIATDSIKQQLEDNPKMKLSIQKIMAEQEIRNRRIDEDPENKKINECE